MDKKNQCQTHYLACGELRELLVRKTGSPDFKPLHPGTMEIEPSGCRFEWEGRQEFQAMDKLEFLFQLEDCSMNAEATVISVDEWRCWDDCYDHKNWYTYRAEFDSELETHLFQRLLACPKRMKT